MPITSVGAIFATQSKLLQRIFIPSVDDSEIAGQFVGAGETLQSIPIATYQQGGIAAVQAAVGIPTFSGRCAVVDPNSKAVIDTIIADPAIYSDPRGQVIAHDHAMLGDIWIGTNFTRIYAQVNNVTGAITSLGAQSIDSATATTGNVLAVPPVGALVGQVIISPAKLAAIGVGA